MTTLSASLDIIDLSDGVLTKTSGYGRSFITEDAAPLPLLTLDPIYRESVQNGTPSPSIPFFIYSVRSPNRHSSTWTIGESHQSGTVTCTLLENGGYKGSRAYKRECTVACSGWYYTYSTPTSELRDAVAAMSQGEKLTVTWKQKGDSSLLLSLCNGFMDGNGTNSMTSPQAMETLGTTEDGWSICRVKLTRNAVAKSSQTIYFKTASGTIPVGAIAYICDIQVTFGNSDCIDYVPDGSHIGVVSVLPSGERNISYLDLQGNELYGLDGTRRDILSIDASGHAILQKRTSVKILDGSITWLLHSSIANWYYVDNLFNDLYKSNSWLGVLSDHNLCDQYSNVGNLADGRISIGFPNNVYDGGARCAVKRNDISSVNDLKTWFTNNPTKVIYGLDQEFWYDIDLGYVNLPEVTDGATVYVAAEIQPSIKGSWWTQAGLAAGEAFKDNRDEDWASRLMVTNAQMAIDKINGQIQTLVSGLDGMTTLTQTDSGFEFTVDDSLTSLLNGLQTDYNSLIHDLGVVVGNHTTELGVLNNYVQVTTENNQPVLRLGSSTNPVVAVLTNTGLEFRQSENGTESVIAYLVIDDDGRGKLKVNTAVVLDTLQFGNWEWYTRPNGNMSIRWIGE